MWRVTFKRHCFHPHPPIGFHPHVSTRAGMCPKSAVFATNIRTSCNGFSRMTRLPKIKAVHQTPSARSNTRPLTSRPIDMRG